jgi:outer membrane lipoprotein-sorting protein
MNCRLFQKRMVELLDTPPEGTADPDLLRHLDDCPACTRELAEARAQLADLHASPSIHASLHFKERVMESIVELEKRDRAGASAPRRGWRSVPKLRMAMAAAVVVLAVASYNFVAHRTGKPEINGFTVLARAAEVMNRLATVHIRCAMRGPANDNFTTINLDGDLIPIDIWVDQGPPLRWRVDKGGRVVTCDGRSSLMLIYAGNDQARPPLALTADSAPGFVGELAPFLDVERLLTRQIDSARTDGSTLLLTHETGTDGRDKIVLTVEATAKGDFSQSDYLRDQSILESDNLRTYQFDRETGRLETMEVYVHSNGKDVLVLEITEIEYDVAVDPALFSTEPPAGVVAQSMDKLNQAGIAASGPKEVAERFFKALIANDWAAVEQISPMTGTFMAQTPEAAEWAKGLTIVELGEPFQSGAYPGWFVPYELRDSEGRIKKHNLAVRNDYPNCLWQVDGGF